VRKELFEHRFKLGITAITGPATDNEVGRDYIAGALGLPAHNALRDAPGLLETTRESVLAWQDRNGRAA
jgi:hypothetical protein